MRVTAGRAGQPGGVTANDSDLVPMPQRRIALVAHDGRKQDMGEWAEFQP
jgi:hypothetical protein